MRTPWPTLLMLPLCWAGASWAQRAPEPPSEPDREVEVAPRGEIGTQGPEAGSTPEGGGVTIGEPQTIGRPQVIGSPQVVGTPQAIGGERAGTTPSESEVRRDAAEGDALGTQFFDPTAPDASQAYGGSSDEGAGTGGSEAWVPGEDRVAGDLPDLDDDPEQWLQAQPDSERPGEGFSDDAFGLDGVEGSAGSGWSAPSPDVPPEDEDLEPAWGGAGELTPPPPAVSEPGDPSTDVEGVVDPDAADDAGSPTPGPQGMAPQDGGGSGADLLSPGLVLGPTDPETGGLLAPPGTPAQLAQTAPGTSDGTAAEPGLADEERAAEPAATGEAASPASSQEETLEALADSNEDSVALQEAQLDVLETQLAQQEEAETRRAQEEADAAMATRQRLMAARLLGQGELALRDGETDLSDDLSAARQVIVEEIGIARDGGRWAQLRDLSEALDRLDAAEQAAETRNSMEAQRWLSGARELLVAPTRGESSGDGALPYP